MSEKGDLKPEIIVFAGPNGSGKSSVTIQARVVQPYVNADEIQKATLCTAMEAAQKADDPQINIIRVSARVENGGHDVPREKIVERYYRCMELVPDIFWLADVFYLYDNTVMPERIAMKKRGKLLLYGNDFWDEGRILELLGIEEDLEDQEI